jgi:hypothetical protein
VLREKTVDETSPDILKTIFVRLQMKVLASIVLAPSIAFAQQVITDADRAAAIQYMRAVQVELKRGNRLLYRNPSDADLGAQSRRITKLIGHALPKSLLFCRGVGSLAYMYWMDALAVFRGDRGNAMVDFQRSEADYNEIVAKCEREIGR